MNNAIAQKILEQVKTTYNSIAPHFSQTRSKLWEDFAYFTPYLRDSQFVLDLGCGNGRLLEMLKNKDIRYIGIDNSKELLEEARKKYANRDISITFKEGDAMNLSGYENDFDVIFFIAAFHHIPSAELRQKVMDNIASSLKPGGVLIMTNWNLFQKRYRPIVVSYMLSRLFSPSKSIEGMVMKDLNVRDVFIPWKSGEKVYNRYVHAYTLQELRDYVESSGLAIKELLYAKRGKKATFLTGTNSIVIAQKTHD